MDDRIGKSAIEMLKRIRNQEGRLLELQLTASGTSRTYNKLRRLGLIKIVPHPTVKVGRSNWPADAVEITDEGRRVLDFS